MSKEIEKETLLLTEEDIIFRLWCERLQKDLDGKDWEFLRGFLDERGINLRQFFDGSGLERGSQHTTEEDINKNLGELTIIGSVDIYLDCLEWTKYPPAIAIHEFNRVTGYKKRAEYLVEHSPEFNNPQTLQDIKDAGATLEMIRLRCPGIDFVSDIQNLANSISREFWIKS